MFKKYGKLSKAHSKANFDMTLTPEGNGGYDMHPDTLMPVMKKAQTPAQHEAVKKAAKVSVMKRKIAAGKIF